MGNCIQIEKKKGKRAGIEVEDITTPTDRNDHDTDTEHERKLKEQSEEADPTKAKGSINNNNNDPKFRKQKSGKLDLAEDETRDSPKSNQLHIVSQNIRGMCKRFRMMASGDSREEKGGNEVPMVTITSATPLTQLPDTHRSYITSINAIHGLQIEIPVQNIGEFMIERLQNLSPSNIVLSIFEGTSQTVQELLDQIEIMKSVLQGNRLDLSPNATVVVLMNTCVQFPALIIAVNVCGFQCVIPNPKVIQDTDIISHIFHLRPEAIFVSKEYSAKADELRLSLDSVKNVVLMDCDVSPHPNQVTLCEIQKDDLNTSNNYSEILHTTTADEDDWIIQSSPWHTKVAFIMWTQGRTAKARPVHLTHANFMASIHQIQCVNLFGKKRAVLGVLPHFHPFGLTFQLYNCISSGAPLFYLPKLDPFSILRCIQQSQISVCIAVPPVVEFLAENPTALNYDLGSLHHMFSMLAPLEKGLMERLYQRFPNLLLYNGYGMCETGSLTHMTSGSRLCSMSIGKILPNTMCKWLVHLHFADPEYRSLNLLRFAQGEPCYCRLLASIDSRLSISWLTSTWPPHGIVVFQIDDTERNVALTSRKGGELCLRGPQIPSTIPNNPLCHTYMDAYGWLHTGDLGYYDESHNFFVHGVVDRLKRNHPEMDGRMRKVGRVKNVGMTPLAPRRQTSAIKKLNHSSDYSGSSDSVFLD